jgi:hypothetical protein
MMHNQILYRPASCLSIPNEKFHPAPAPLMGHALLSDFPLWVVKELYPDHSNDSHHNCITFLIPGLPVHEMM